MLISQRHHFLFIHIYKNAGRSIATALMPHAASGINQLMDKAFRKVGLIMPNSPEPLEGHVTAEDIIKYLGEEQFASLFSFAIVRNPWSWQVSLYEFMRMRDDHHQYKLASKFSNFDEYIDWRCKYDTHYQKDFIYSVEGKKLVSYVGRYENLEEDFKDICDHIGITARLPKLNVSAKKPYQEYYNKRTIELVRLTFRDDVELFEYDYE